MPVSPALGERLAQPVVDVYAEAELILLRRIARSLAAGIEDPTWAERKLLEVQLLQRSYAADLRRLHAGALQRLTDALRMAWSRGQATAEADLGVTAARARAASIEPALATIVRDAAQNLGAVEFRTLTAVPGLYRDVVAKASQQVLVGVLTRREAAQQALDGLATRGITGFVDRAGRRWELASYVEMATRAATGRAAVEGHTTRLQAAGYDLVVVSDAPQECHLCRPFEGRVFSLSGAAGRYPSLQSARVAGLFHPGCRHSTGLYQAGVTQLPERTADPDGDRARQHLRYLERRVRAAKRREAAAMDDQARTVARRDVRAEQARIREHVAETSAKRQPQRERVGSAR